MLWPLSHAPAVPDLAGRTLLAIAGPPRETGGLCDALEAAGAEVSLCLDARDAVASVADDIGAWDAVIVPSRIARCSVDEVVRWLRTADAGLPLAVAEGVARPAGAATVLPRQPRRAVAALADLLEGSPCAC